MRVLPALCKRCVAYLVLARNAGAQPTAAPPTPPGSARAPGGACSADSGLFATAPVFVRVEVNSAVGPDMSRDLLLIAQEVAARIRAALGDPNALVAGDSIAALGSARTAVDSIATTLAPRGMDSAGVRVVATRGGAFRWGPLRTAPSAAAALLDRALADVNRTGDLVIMPDAFTRDSVIFTLRYQFGVEGGAGYVHAIMYGPATMAVFTLRVPVERQAAAVPGTLKAHYPESALYGRYERAEGVVHLQFVIDTTGRAVEGTIHDVWPKDRPRLSGSLGDHYQAFVDAAKRGVLGATFYPAEIAGCKVKQLVYLPFTWEIRR